MSYKQSVHKYINAFRIRRIQFEKNVKYCFGNSISKKIGLQPKNRFVDKKIRIKFKALFYKQIYITCNSLITNISVQKMEI
jgi:hypothetical protein